VASDWEASESARFLDTATNEFVGFLLPHAADTCHTFQSEEAAPCFVVLSGDVLRRSRANERDILLVGLRVPIQLQAVDVLLAVKVVDFIPEFPGVHGYCLMLDFVRQVARNSQKR
jgi:hypothetical protein